MKINHFEMYEGIQPEIQAFFAIFQTQEKYQGTHNSNIKKCPKWQ